MADGYTIKHRDEFEAIEGSGGATWRLARRALGTSTFGAPAGTFASCEPPVSRTILNRSERPVVALLIGVQGDGGYEPMSWA